MSGRLIEMTIIKHKTARLFLACVFFAYTPTAFAEDFFVFENSGLYGIKDAFGEILIPAVYEKLGWSNHNTEVFNGVIGFRKNQLWGLISIKNKVMAQNKYYTITPFGNTFLKASVKNKFSNLLSYGLLEPNGNIKIDFHYSELHEIGKQILATTMHNFKTKTGIITHKNEILIPLEFESIEQHGTWFLSKRLNGSLSVYLTNGKQVVDQVDSIKVVSNGLIAYQNGYAGFLKKDGTIGKKFIYKDFRLTSGEMQPVTFAQWDVYNTSQKIKTWHCDSLTFSNSVWIAHLNGAQHIAIEGREYPLNGYDLIKNHYQMIVRHTKTKKCGIVSKQGKFILNDFDLVDTARNVYLTQNANKWYIYNQHGTRINSAPFQDIRAGLKNYFIAKRNDYWGVIDFNADTYIGFKYDSIKPLGDGQYAVKFINQWGIMTLHGHWVVEPSFTQLVRQGNYQVGVRGQAFSFLKEGKWLTRTTNKVEYIANQRPVVKSHTALYGLISKHLTWATPQYDTIYTSGTYTCLQKGKQAMLLDNKLNVVVPFREGYEQFGTVKEAYIPAKKKGRWGYLDLQGRLRISNRYEDVKPFHEEMAAIKLRGKWGFINKTEKLIIQPFYDSVQAFHEDLAIFSLKGEHGAVNKNGQEVLSGWANVKRLPTGNFMIQDSNGLVGMADKQGNIIIRPNFDELKDMGEQIIVKRNHQYGLLDDKGHTILSARYKEITPIKGYIAVRVQN